MNELKMYFLDVIKNKYAAFDGRARRAEYWYFCLFNFLAGVITSFIWEPLNWIYSLVVLIPGIALGVRRLHDIGKSGWWCLLSLLPVVGNLILMIWFCRDSQPGKNQWGYSPKY